VRERTVEVAGATLYVKELGAEDAPPVVVLHGGPAAHHDYLLPAFAELAGAFRLVFYDQRGGGRSTVTREADLSWPRHVEDVGAVLDALSLARPHLVGYSFGGLWAMLFAARHPDRVARLALVSSVPGWHGYRARLEERLAAAQSSAAVKTEREALERSGLRESLPEEHRRRRFALSIAGYFVDPRLAHAVTPFRVQARTAEAIARSLGAFDFRDELAALDGSRTLFVHGAEDPVDPSLAADLAARIGARFESLPGCGHVPYVEAVAPFFGILREFLGGPA
jgi:proline iminopeptidase